MAGLITEIIEASRRRKKASRDAVTRAEGRDDVEAIFDQLSSGSELDPGESAKFRNIISDLEKDVPEGEFSREERARRRVGTISNTAEAERGIASTPHITPALRKDLFGVVDKSRDDRRVDIENERKLHQRRIVNARKVKEFGLDERKVGQDDRKISQEDRKTDLAEDKFSFDVTDKNRDDVRADTQLDINVAAGEREDFKLLLSEAVDRQTRISIEKNAPYIAKLIDPTGNNVTPEDVEGMSLELITFLSESKQNANSSLKKFLFRPDPDPENPENIPQPYPAWAYSDSASHEISWIMDPTRGLPQEAAPTSRMEGTVFGPDGQPIVQFGNRASPFEKQLGAIGTARGAAQVKMETNLSESHTALTSLSSMLSDLIGQRRDGSASLDTITLGAANIHTLFESAARILDTEGFTSMSKNVSDLNGFDDPRVQQLLTDTGSARTQALELAVLRARIQSPGGRSVRITEVAQALEANQAIFSGSDSQAESAAATLILMLAKAYNNELAGAKNLYGDELQVPLEFNPELIDFVGNYAVKRTGNLERREMDDILQKRARGEALNMEEWKKIRKRVPITIPSQPMEGQ